MSTFNLLLYRRHANTCAIQLGHIGVLAKRRLVPSRRVLWRHAAPRRAIWIAAAAAQAYSIGRKWYAVARLEIRARREFSMAFDRGYWAAGADRLAVDFGGAGP